MTVTVWFRGHIEQIIEDVRRIKSVGSNVVQIELVENGSIRYETVQLDGETSIMIDVEGETRYYDE